MLLHFSHTHPIVEHNETIARRHDVNLQWIDANSCRVHTTEGVNRKRGRFRHEKAPGSRDKILDPNGGPGYSPAMRKTILGAVPLAVSLLGVALGAAQARSQVSSMPAVCDPDEHQPDGCMYPGPVLDSTSYNSKEYFVSDPTETIEKTGWLINDACNCFYGPCTQRVT